MSCVRRFSAPSTGNERITVSDAPRALVVRSAGTNCDGEMVRGFSLAGARTTLEHIDRLIADPARIEAYDIFGFAGGFSYGDDLGAGRVLAVKIRRSLFPALRRAARRGAPMLGVCNGFQTLAQSGLLPGFAVDRETDGDDAPPPQIVALAINAGGRFIDDWPAVEYDQRSPCLWTRGMGDYPHEVMMLPLASGEGRFVADEAVIERLRRAGQIPVRYRDNLNGSMGAVAGICDPTGRIFGLMPHPDRYLEWMNHPRWTRLPEEVRRGDTPGLRLFSNAVEAVHAGRTGA